MLDRNGILHLSGDNTIGPGLHEAAFLRSPLGQASESNSFTWGRIESGYVPNSGSSSIIVSYKES